MILALSSCILLSIPITRLAPATAVGGAATSSLAIRSMVRAVRAPSFLTRSSYISRWTPDTTHMLVIREANSKTAILCFFIAHSLISFSIMIPTSMGNPLTMTYKSTNLSCEIVVVCVVGINLDFKNFTHTLAMGFKSILLITRPSSLAQDALFMVRVLKILFHFYGVILPSNLAYSQSTLEGKL